MQIHAFENNGLHILLDVPSGSVHVVDLPVYDMVLYYDGVICRHPASAADTAEEIREKAEEAVRMLSDRYPKEELEEAAAEIASLAEAGTLFSDTEYRPAAEAFANRKTVIKALCLHVAHDCNLRCKYCFADEGEYHGRRALMDLETGKAALDFLITSSGARRNLEVDFFGGEPLMNLGVVKQLVAYGRSKEEESGKHFRFTLTTNGVLLDDDFAEFANRELDNVVLSIDGRKEVHDRMRPFPGGQGSYDVVLPKFRKFIEARGDKQYYLRGTYTRENTDFAADVLDLADQGFTSLSIEPVVAPPEEPYALRREDIPFLLKQYDILEEEMNKRRKEGRPFTFFHFMIDLTGGPCVYKRLSGCGAGCEYLAVTPWGDLYPCHQFVGQEEFLLGNVRDGISRTDLCDQFRKVNVYEKPSCAECFARFYCSGGCAANAYHFSGSLTGDYEIGCELQRKRVECAIGLEAARLLSEGE